MHSDPLHVLGQYHYMYILQSSDVYMDFRYVPAAYTARPAMLSV